MLIEQELEQFLLQEAKKLFGKDFDKGEGQKLITLFLAFQKYLKTHAIVQTPQGPGTIT